MRFLLLAPLLFLFSFGLAFVQADTADFRINLLVGSDLNPPTTPTLLSAIPVAVSQIDLLWTASTDNFYVSGYSVQRDGFPIATTTLLNYSDTGLSSSTLYSYTVRAFDLALNYSTTSNSIATTTLSPPVIPPVVATSTPLSSKGEESTSARVVLTDLSIESSFSTTSFKVETAYPARLEIRWGRTISYELGYIVSGIYKKTNTFLLSDLEPGTTYEYEIIGYSPFGLPFVLERNTFTTKEERKFLSPANVLRFEAEVENGSVALSWQFPATNDLAKVRIVRSHYGFPEYPANGAILYEGMGTGVTDVDILNQYSPVYYTAFVYDIYGNVSSGAVVKVYVLSDGFDNQPPADIVSEPTVEIDESRLTTDTIMPELSDILIIQSGKEFSMLEAPLELDSTQPFSVRVPVGTVSNNLKSLIVTVIDPTHNKKNYSFLLRINKDQSAYEAVVAPLRVSGRSQIILEVFDFEFYVVATYKSPIFFLEIGVDESNNFLLGLLFKYMYIVLVSILLLAAVLFWFLLVKRCRTEYNKP